jgi:hypothetical protein
MLNVVTGTDGDVYILGKLPSCWVLPITLHWNFEVGEIWPFEKNVQVKVNGTIITDKNGCILLKNVGYIFIPQFSENC